DGVVYRNRCSKGASGATATEIILPPYPQPRHLGARDAARNDKHVGSRIENRPAARGICCRRTFAGCDRKGGTNCFVLVPLSCVPLERHDRFREGQSYTH